MKKIFPSLVSGFGAAVLTTIPLLKGFACCLLVPGAAIVALFLDRKINHNLERIKIQKALFFGFMTGLFATFFITSFDLLLTYLTKSNDLFRDLDQTEALMRDWNFGPMLDESIKMINHMALEIETTGFSTLYAVMIFFTYFISNSIFGMLGGALGMAVLNKKTD